MSTAADASSGYNEKGDYMLTTRAKTILLSCLTLLALLPFSPADAADWSYSSDGPPEQLQAIWGSDAIKTLSVVQIGRQAAIANSLLLQAGDIHFSFGDCAGTLEVDDIMEDINGSLWAFTNQSLYSEKYAREEVAFYGGTMYWRSTSTYVFDEVYGFSISRSDLNGDMHYSGFLINPKSLLGANLYIVWGRVNLKEPALTMKAVGMAGLLPDFVRLRPVFNRKITFHRKTDTGWSLPLASPPVLQHWKSVSPVGTFDGGVLWTLGIDNSTGKRIIAGIADPEDAGYFLPEPTVAVLLPSEHNVRGVAVEGNYIWYTEYNTEKIYQITKDGDNVTSFSAPGATSGIVVKDGRIWYVDNAGSTIYTCDMNGTCGRAISLPFNNPYGIAFDGTYFWVTDSIYGKMLYKIDMDGNIVSLIYPPTGGRTGNGPLSTPYSIALSGSNLWLFGIGGEPGSFGWDLYKLDIAELQKIPVMNNEYLKRRGAGASCSSCN